MNYNQIRNQVIEDRPWLKKLIGGKGADLIIDSDYDGYLSGLILSCLSNSKVVGIYNKGQLAINKKYQPHKCIWVDLDVARREVISIGHHITSYSAKHDLSYLYNPLGIQINDIFDVYVKNTQDHKKSFAYKYPLSTATFLIWLFDYDPNHFFSDWQMTLLSYADGVLINNLKYCESVQYWIDRVFGVFYDEPLDRAGVRKNCIRFRKKRNFLCSVKKGQGKGSDKIKKMKLKDGRLLDDRICFIEWLGKEMNFPYNPSRWQCWDNLELHEFSKQEDVGSSIVSNLEEIIRDPSNMISLIFGNSAGKISYTKASNAVIEKVFGEASSKILV